MTGSNLLDTSVVIEYLRFRSDIQTKLQAIEFIYLPLVVIGELLYGAFRSKDSETASKQINEFCRACIILLPDEETAVQYARTKVQLADAGTPIPQNDIWIAATAKQYGLSVAARDRHFSQIADLTVLSW